MLHCSNVPKCRRFEVPTPPAANSVRNFKSKSGTRIIELLVPLCFRSSCQSVLRCITNFGNGALGAVPEGEFEGVYRPGRSAPPARRRPVPLDRVDDLAMLAVLALHMDRNQSVK